MGRCRFCGQSEKIVTRKLESGIDETEVRCAYRHIAYRGIVNLTVRFQKSGRDWSFGFRILASGGELGPVSRAN
jgi:hypothetical protein